MGIEELDNNWMREALQLAQQAQLTGEVPIGAILVDNESQTILGRGFNAVIQNHDPSAHAEIMALRDAGQTIKNYRLINTTMYVTLEPCPMCAMALVHARISRLVYAASDPKLGIFSQNTELLSKENLNHQFEVTAGILSEVASEKLRHFFKAKRVKTEVTE